jgi:hypothetical protein
VGHPDEQAWPYKLGDEWVIERSGLDADAPPVHADIYYRVYGDNPGNFNFKSVDPGVVFWKANFAYRYNLPNRPPLVLLPFHDWGMKDLDPHPNSFKYEAAALEGFLEDILIKNKDRYPQTYVITFHQLIKYMKKNDLAAILAEQSGQDQAEAERDYPDF